MPETMRLIDPDGITRDVALDVVPSLLADSRWRVPTAQDEASRLSSQAAEESYGGVGGGIKAGAAALARGATLGLSDVAARAIGGEDAAIALEGYRSENPGLSFAGELVGGVAPALVTGGAALPAGAAASLGRSASAAAGGGLRGALAAGAVEGGLAGAGMGASQLALSRDPLTFERAAATIGSNALFGAGIGGALGAAANGVERGLHRAGAAIDDYAARRAAREAVAPDLVNMDRKGLKLAEEAELARIEAERAGQRVGVADEIAAFRDDLKQQKIWLTTKKGADEAVPPVEAPDHGTPVPDAPDPAATAPESALDRMSLAEIEDYQKVLDAKFGEVKSGTPEYQALSDEWDASVLRKKVLLGEAPAPKHQAVRPPGAEPHVAAMSDDEFGKYSSSFAERLTEEEREAAIKYSRASHGTINKALREGAADEMGDYYRTSLNRLDSLMAKASTPRDMVVMRGIRDDRVAKRFKAMKPGDEFVDDGFVSTTVAGKATDEFASPEVEFRIAVPKGSKAAPIPATKTDERELLLDRGQRFRVDSVAYDPVDKKTVIKVSLIRPAVRSRATVQSEYDDVMRRINESKDAKVRRELSKQRDALEEELDGLALGAPHVEEVTSTDPLSDEEYAAFKESWSNAADDHYKHELYYSKGGDEVVNPALRSGKPLDGDALKLRDGLDAAFREPESRITRPVTLYRGMPGANGVKERFANVKPGDILEDPAYTSTSFDEFAKSRNEEIVFTIHAPAGTPALPLRSQYTFEGEMLLPRGTKFRVNKIEDVPVSERWDLPEDVEYEILEDNSVHIFYPDGSEQVKPPIRDIDVSIVSAFDPPSASARHPVDLSWPIENLSMRQLKERQGLIRQQLDVAPRGSPERQQLADEWDAAVGRMNDIDSGKVPKPAHDWAPEQVGKGVAEGAAEEAVSESAGQPRGAPVPTSPSPTPQPAPPQIEGLGPLGKRLLKTDRALDRLLDNPKALADRPQRALDALQMQEAAYEAILAKSDDLRIKFAADTSGDRIAALEAIPAALERNRQLQQRIGELLQPPRTPRLDAIAEARDVLMQPAAPKGMVEQIFGGAAFGAVTSAVGSIPVLGQIPGVAAIIGAKGAELATRVVFGKMGQSIGAQAERAASIVKALTGAVKATAPYAPVVATRTLAALRYGKDEGEGDQPKTLPALYKKRSDEIKQLTAYDETGTPRMRPAVREALGRALKPIAAIDPIMADRIETQKARGIEYLSSILPRRPDLPGVNDNWQPGDMDMRSWARAAAAVEDPYGVLERAIHGAVTPEDAAVMRNVWPEMLAAFTGEVMSKLPELRASLPYSRQLALSILTGEAVTPAMDRKVMRVLQAQFPDEPGSAGGTQAPKAQPQFGSMRATTDQMTPSQSRVQGAV